MGDGEGGKMNYTKKYAEVFNFHKQHYPPDKTDEYWERTSADMIELIEEYAYDEFMKHLLIAVYDELAKVSKERGTKQ